MPSCATNSVLVHEGKVNKFVFWSVGEHCPIQRGMSHPRLQGPLGLPAPPEIFPYHRDRCPRIRTAENVMVMPGLMPKGTCVGTTPPVRHDGVTGCGGGAPRRIEYDLDRRSHAKSRILRIPKTDLCFGGQVFNGGHANAVRNINQTTARRRPEVVTPIKRGYTGSPDEFNRVHVHRHTIPRCHSWNICKYKFPLLR